MKLLSSPALAWPLGLGLLLMLLVAGPDLAQLWSALPGYYNDDAAHGVYLHHQFHDAVMAGRFDLFDPHQFFPTGYHPARTNGGNSLEMVVSGLTRAVLPWPSWLSLAYLLWIPLNILAFVPLGRRLWGCTRTAALVGAVWAVLPPMLGQIAAGRLTQVALVGLPLAVAGFLDIKDRGGRRAVLLAGVGWALTGLGYWFNALFLALLVPVFVVAGARARGVRPMLRDTALAACLAFSLVSPILLVIFWPLVSGGWMPTTPVDPTALSPVFSDALQLVGEQSWVNVGWLPFVLVPGVVWTLARGQRKWLWLALTVIPILAALGPAQVLGDRVWRLPYYVVWQWVPGFARMLHPERWLLVAGLFGVILAADAMVRWRRWTAIVLLAGVLGQQWAMGTLPLGNWAPQLPAHWVHVAKADGAGAVISVPLGRSQNTSAYQPFVGRPLLGGMLEDQVWMVPPAQRTFVAASGFLKGLQALSVGRNLSLELSAADRRRLTEAGFSTVVFDAQSWRRVRSSAGIDPVKVISKTLGRPLFQGPSGAVWGL